MSLGVIYAFLTAICFGITGVIDKIGVSSVNSPLVYSLQSLLVALIITTLLTVLYLNKSLRKCLRIPRKIWLYIIMVGILASGLFVYFRFIGLVESTGTFANLSQIMTTSLTAILAWKFLREKLPIIFWILFTIIIISTLLVSIGEIKLVAISRGDLFILIGTFFLAAANIFSKLAAEKVHPMVITVVRFVFGVMTIVIIGGLFNPIGLFSQPITIWAVLSGLLWTGSVIFFNFALQRISVTATTSILMLGPILTLVLESVYLKQSFTQVQILAAIIVVCCGLFITRLKTS